MLAWMGLGAMGGIALDGGGDVSGQQADRVASDELFFLTPQGVFESGRGVWYCGNDENAESYARADYRSPLLIINAFGETIERIATPSLVWRVSATALVVDSAHKDEPIKDRRLITPAGSYSYTEAWMPIFIGNGIIAWTGDRDYTGERVGFMTTGFEPIEDIGAYIDAEFGIDIGAHEFVGFVAGTAIPVVGAQGNRRVVLRDGTLSDASYRVSGFSGTLARYHGLITVSSVRGAQKQQQWVMDPTTGELLYEIDRNAEVHAGPELLIFRRPGEKQYDVFTPEFEWVIDLPMRVYPLRVTSAGLWICSDSRERRGAAVNSNRAMRVHRATMDTLASPRTTPARIEWIDHAPYRAIDATVHDHLLCGWEEDGSPVVFDGALRPISTLPEETYPIWIARSGSALCGSYSSKQSGLTLYSKEGEVLRTFDTRTMFRDPEFRDPESADPTAAP